MIKEITFVSLSWISQIKLNKLKPKYYVITDSMGQLDRGEKYGAL